MPRLDRRLGLAVVRGRSMEPTLREGDRLLVVHGAQAQVGRLAVVRLVDRRGASVVAVKRVTSRRPDGWWVEADNPVPEALDSRWAGVVPAGDVVARVVARVWPSPRRL